jgi:hypothetical protein
MATTVVVQLRGSLANRALDLSNRVGGTATAVMTNRPGPDRDHRTHCAALRVAIAPSRCELPAAVVQGGRCHVRARGQPNYRWRSSTAGKRNHPGTGEVP